MRTRFERATPGDYVACLLIPFWGVAVGLVALIRGDKRRGWTMVAVGGIWLLLLALLAL